VGPKEFINLAGNFSEDEKKHVKKQYIRKLKTKEMAKEINGKMYVFPSFIVKEYGAE